MTTANKLALLTNTKEALRQKLGIGTDLPFSEYYKYAYPYNPVTLFTGGKQGAIYDPSDLTTLWQDAAGTVPVTKSGDPVGLMKDKSGNGNHAKQAVSAARPTYQTDGILHKLVFDGVDDCMIATLSAALSTLGKLTLAVGVNAINTSSAFIIEQGANSSSFNSFNLLKSSGDYTYTGRGNRVAFADDITKVNTSLSRIVAIAEHDLNAGIPSSLTVNNLAKANSVNTTFGSGGFGSASLNIGSRNGGSFFYKGDMYGIVVVGDVTSSANKDALKQYLAAKSGVTL